MDQAALTDALALGCTTQTTVVAKDASLDELRKAWRDVAEGLGDASHEFSDEYLRTKNAKKRKTMWQTYVRTFNIAPAVEAFIAKHDLVELMVRTVNDTIDEGTGYHCTADETWLVADDPLYGWIYKHSKERETGAVQYKDLVRDLESFGIEYLNLARSCFVGHFDYHDSGSRSYSQEECYKASLVIRHSDVDKFQNAIIADIFAEHDEEANE